MSTCWAFLTANHSVQDMGESLPNLISVKTYQNRQKPFEVLVIRESRSLLESSSFKVIWNPRLNMTSGLCSVTVVDSETQPPFWGWNCFLINKSNKRGEIEKGEKLKIFEIQFILGFNHFKNDFKSF